MKNLSHLLNRISQVLNKNSLVKESILGALENELGIKIPPQSIFLKDGVLEINSNPSIKNEIRIKEEKVLKNLKEQHNIYISRVLYK